MNVLLVGAGAVGEAITVLARRADPGGKWLGSMVVGDYNIGRAREVAARVPDGRFAAVQVDAGNQEQISALCGEQKIDFVMNACAPNFNMPIFGAAFAAGCTYMDMAMSLSARHPKSPYAKTHVKLGDLQFAEAPKWERAGVLAILGSGVEPGMVNVFARFARDHLFDEIHELNVRDGDNLTVEGLGVAFGFSIWTTIEECLNPPVIWERERGWFTTAPFSEAEIFPFPQPVGPTQVVNVEHEEVLMFPRYFADNGLRRCTFKYGLDEHFRSVLKTLEALGLDKTQKIPVGDVMVAPRDVVAAAAPDPARIGHLMKGTVCAGLWIKGRKDGLERSVYLYNLADNRSCMDSVGSQAVVAQTAFNPVIMMELLATGRWRGKGVLTPEYFPAEPFLDRMQELGFPPAMMEMESEYKRSRDLEALRAGLS
jgi:saccharopine dehydrogenase-like NADP-dependent oxidoreductase